MPDLVDPEATGQAFKVERFDGIVHQVATGSALEAAARRGKWRNKGDLTTL